MNYIHFSSVSSTNEYLKNAYKELDDWTVVTADYQTKGHGRFERVWHSEKKANLICSVLIKDKKTLKNIECLSLLTGVVIYKLLTRLGLKNIQIKWPNDVYVNNQKIAGVLLESKSNSKRLDALIIGVGINFNQTKFPKDINATSYALLTNKTIKVNKINEIYIKMLKREINLLNHHMSRYLNIINKNNYLKNRYGYAKVNGKRIKVQFLEIDKNNTLVALHNNRKIKIRSNEVTLI